MNKMMKSCKKYWSTFIFGGIVAFICFIIILVKGEAFLWQAALQAISSGNLTPDKEGVIIGAYGVHSTIAFSLLAVSIGLFSIGMAFYSQISLENQIEELLARQKRMENPKTIRIRKKPNKKSEYHITYKR